MFVSSFEGLFRSSIDGLGVLSDRGKHLKKVGGEAYQPNETGWFQISFCWFPLQPGEENLHFEQILRSGFHS